MNLNRKDFLKSCAFACVKGVALATLFQSCKNSKSIIGTIIESNIHIDLSEFIITKNNITSFRKQLIIQNENIKYPISVFRLSEYEYKAIYLECTHQGAELQVFGDKIHCPIHGAEFNNKGEVEIGPAESNLRIFPCSINNNQIIISLK